MPSSDNMSELSCVMYGGQVIEARNLAVPTDLLHTFYTMDSYTVVSCTSEAGVTSHHTKIERNNLQPHWNERCIFEDVALSNSLTVAIFDHKKLSSDLFLGQVCPVPPAVHLPSRPCLSDCTQDLPQTWACPAVSRIILACMLSVWIVQSVPVNKVHGGADCSTPHGCQLA